MDPESQFILFIFSIVCYLVLSFVVGQIARGYKRSSVAWFLLSLFTSPLCAWLYLVVAGIPHTAVVKAEKTRAVRDRHPDKSDAEVLKIVNHEENCPECGAVVNSYTSEGIVQREPETWMLHCAACGAPLPDSSIDF